MMAFETVDYCDSELSFRLPLFLREGAPHSWVGWYGTGKEKCQFVFVIKCCLSEEEVNDIGQEIESLDYRYRVGGILEARVGACPFRSATRESFVLYRFPNGDTRGIHWMMLDRSGSRSFSMELRGGGSMIGEAVIRAWEDVVRYVKVATAPTGEGADRPAEANHACPERAHGLVVSEGGPHVILPESFAGSWPLMSWDESEPLASLRELSDAGSFFGRLVHSTALVDVVDVGGATVVVMAEPYVTTWRHRSDGDGFYVFLLDGIEATELNTVVDSVSPTLEVSGWSATGLRWELPCDGAIMMSFLDDPTSGENCLCMRVGRGTYEIAVTEVQSKGSDEVIRVLRFDRILVP